MNEIIIALIGIVATTLGSWITWFLARKKYNSEVDRNTIENMDASLSFYEKLCNDTEARLEEALKDNKELREEISLLRKEIDSLRKTMLQLTTQICTDLTCQLRLYQTEIKDKKKK